jgi:hypothetical protein
MVRAVSAGRGAEISCDKLLGQRNANTLQLNATPMSTNIMRGDYSKFGGFAYASRRVSLDH